MDFLSLVRFFRLQHLQQVAHRIFGSLLVQALQMSHPVITHATIRPAKEPAFYLYVAPSGEKVQSVLLGVAIPRRTPVAMNSAKAETGSRSPRRDRTALNRAVAGGIRWGCLLEPGGHHLLVPTHISRRHGGASCLPPVATMSARTRGGPWRN